MLTQYQNGQLQQVIDIIVKSVAPEKIYLLGVSVVRHSEYNIFNMQLPGDVAAPRVIHYFLSVITRSDDDRNKDELQDMVEGRCKCAATPVTVYIDPLDVFDEWLATGNYFAFKVHKEAVLVYSSSNSTSDMDTSIAGQYHQPPPADPGKELLRTDATITEFLAGTELYRLRRQFTLGAFLLHQAAEQALTILIKVVTGYKVVTHNLDKLLRYARPFSDDIAALYWQLTSNEKENKLFRLIQQAYVHSRYRDEYTVKESELAILYEQVKRLQKIVMKTATQNIQLHKEEACL